MVETVSLHVPSNPTPLGGGGEGQDDAARSAVASRPSSLSLCNNYTGKSKKHVSSSVAKKAETLFLNLESLIKRRGLNYCGFLTLTFADNVTCRKEAARRFKSLHAHFLSQIPNFEYAAAVERQSRGAIHYHLVCAFPWDIRSGFDFKSLSAANSATKEGNLVKRRQIEKESDFFNASPDLRSFWSNLRLAARRYHFGRCETLPIISNAEACARYVGCYVGKEFALREDRDRGLRTVRYRMKQRVAHPQFSWVSGHGQVWRLGCSLLSALLDTQDFTTHFGKNWSWRWRREISAFGRHPGDVAEALQKMNPSMSLADRMLTAVTLGRAILTFEKAATVRSSAEKLETCVARYRAVRQVFYREGSVVSKPIAPFYRLDLRDSASLKSGALTDSSESHPQKPPLFFYP